MHLFIHISKNGCKDDVPKCSLFSGNKIIFHNRMFCFFDNTNLEVYVGQQFKGVGVETDILHHLGVMHVVGKISRWREVTEGHHLFGAVDDHRLVDVSMS